MAQNPGIRDGYGSDIRRTEEHVGGNTRVLQEEHRSTTGARGQREEHHSITGTLHRSGSSSSSSSEDDGQGGRRKKKGMMNKIKEKLPGGHCTEEHSHAGSNVHHEVHSHAGSNVHHEVHHEAHHDHEKKGMMEKIMEKLPGHN